MSTIHAPDLVTADGTLAVGVEILETLFDEAPEIAFFVKDQTGRYLVVNRSLVLRHGLQRKSQLIGNRPSDICPGLFGRVPANQDSRVLKTGRPILNHLEMQLRQPHCPCWCLTTKLPMRNEKGDVTGVIGFSRDLREPVPLDDIPESMAGIIAEFEKNCGQPTSPARLAAASGLSPARFARLTKKIFGLTPSQMITRARITASSRLLLETDDSVANIGLECGFCDHSAFTRAFRSATGLTPTEFRNQESDGS